MLECSRDNTSPTFIGWASLGHTGNCGTAGIILIFYGTTPEVNLLLVHATYKLVTSVHIYFMYLSSLSSQCLEDGPIPLYLITLHSLHVIQSILKGNIIKFLYLQIKHNKYTYVLTLIHCNIHEKFHLLYQKEKGCLHFSVRLNTISSVLSD